MLLVASCFLAGCGAAVHNKAVHNKIDATKVQANSPKGYVPMDAQRVARRWPITLRNADVVPVTAICYHEVGASAKDKMSISAEAFRTHIQQYKQAGYTLINVDDLAEIQAGKKPAPKNPLLITFDDGYTNNYTHALPITVAEGVRATVFMVSGKIGTGNRLTVDELKEMHKNGWAIGSHTVNHENLVPMSEQEIEFELKNSRETLEQQLGCKVNAVAFPCGKADDRVIRMAQKYYPLGFFANVNPNRKETRWTYNRFGVFQWNDNINSIFEQKQPKI